MPLTPSLLEQFIFLKLNVGPGPLMDVFSAVGFRSVRAASNLGVFAALAQRPQSAVALAETLGTDKRATLLLLRALDALGYVERKGGPLLQHRHDPQVDAPGLGDEHGAWR
jgi:hypothetical protein